MIYDEKTKLFIQLHIETLFFHTLLVIIFEHLYNSLKIRCEIDNWKKILL